MIEKIRHALEKKYPTELVQSLLQSYMEIRHNYSLGKYEASELNGGKFVEACVRVLQFETSPHQHYTPLGVSVHNIINTLRSFENVSSSVAHESYRLHIPRVLIGVYNIRNKRGVGHLGGDVNANLMDATYIVSVANWVLAELYRLVKGTLPEDSAQVIKRIVTPQIPLIYDIGNVKRILNPNLPFRAQALLFLYAVFPEYLKVVDLLRYTEYSNPSVFRKKILVGLHKNRFIEYDQEQDACALLPPGVRYVETSILQKEV